MVCKAVVSVATMLVLTCLGGGQIDEVVLRIPETDANKNSDVVRSVAFSPDGQTVAAGYGRHVGLLQDPRPGQVILWDAHTGNRLAALVGYKDGVSSVAFSPDGRLLAAAGFAGDIKIWDTRTRKLSSHLIAPAKPGIVSAVSFSPDGRYLAAALWTRESEGQACVWEVATGKITTRFTGHTDAVQAVAFSPDGALLATGSMDGTARLWDTATGRVRAVLTCQELVGLARTRFRAIVPASSELEYEPQPSVNSVAFSPDGRRLAAAFGESVPGYQTGLGMIKLWDVATGKLQAAIGDHGDIVKQIAYSPDGRFVAVAAQGKPAKLWNAASLKESVSLKGGWPFAFSPHAKHVVVNMGEAALRIQKTDQKTCHR